MNEPLVPLDDEPPPDRGLIVRICVVQTILFVLASLALTKGVWYFERIFKDFDATFPGPTKLVLDASHFYAASWFLFVPVWLGVMAVLVVLCRTRQEEHARGISFAMAVYYGLWFLVLVIAMLHPLVALVRKLS